MAKLQWLHPIDQLSNLERYSSDVQLEYSQVAIAAVLGCEPWLMARRLELLTVVGITSTGLLSRSGPLHSIPPTTLPEKNP